MGHYASEMSPDWGKGTTEINAWQKAGFVPVYLSGHREKLECPHCAAIVKNWRKHQQWHKEVTR
jgi:tRNA(Met) C34 N-acetyltransferase TmcA